MILISHLEEGSFPLSLNVVFFGIFYLALTINFKSYLWTSEGLKDIPIVISELAERVPSLKSRLKTFIRCDSEGGTYPSSKRLF